MVYLDYEINYRRCQRAERAYMELLTRKGEIVSSNVNYKAQLEEENIEERLSVAKEIMSECEIQLEETEQALKNSCEIMDRIYYYKHLQGRKTEWIAQKVNYSAPYLYKLLQKMEKAISETISKE